jgi:hypothetical protein
LESGHLSLDLLNSFFMTIIRGFLLSEFLSWGGSELSSLLCKMFFDGGFTSLKLSL